MLAPNSHFQDSFAVEQVFLPFSNSDVVSPELGRNTMTEVSPEDQLSRWYVIHTKPNQEQRAGANLQAWRIETFAPLLKRSVVHQYTRQIIPKSEPLFPCYIFARFQANLLHKIRLTRGIHSVVSFGDRPSAVDDEIIDLLRARVEEDGFVKVEQRLKKGDKVVINNGPLEGLNGIFEAEAKPLDRVRILLTTVRYQARLVIDRNIVQLTN